MSETVQPWTPRPGEPARIEWRLGNDPEPFTSSPAIRAATVDGWWVIGSDDRRQYVSHSDVRSVERLAPVPAAVAEAEERDRLTNAIAEAIVDGPLDIDCPNPSCRARRNEPCMEVTGRGRRQKRDGAHVRRQAQSIAAAVLAASPAVTEGERERIEVERAVLVQMHNEHRPPGTDEPSYWLGASEALLTERAQLAVPACNEQYDAKVAEIWQLMNDVESAAARDDERERLLALLRLFVDDEPCRFDHNGWCQNHTLDQDRPGACPMLGVRAVLAAALPEGQDLCAGGDAACPCQDGDACHYAADADTPAMPIPSRESQ